jgi:hypothetical protein
VWRVHGGGGGGGYLGGVRGRDRARGGQHQLGEVRATFPFLDRELIRIQKRNLFILAGGLRLRTRIFWSVSGSAACS